MNEQFEQAAQLIAESDSLWIGAGAGMGVDSGLPDFRGNEGFWNSYPPYRHLGLSFYDLANPVWFAKKPQQAWGFYGHRLNLYRDIQPHHGFELLRKWCRNKPGGYFVFTSNVDGHFQRAGFAEERVVECHGSIHYLQCTHPCSGDIWSSEDFRPDIDDTTMQAAHPLVQCPECNRIARPNILMFGDWNWVDSRCERQMARYEDWLNESQRNRVVLEFGAGTAVPSVRCEAERVPGQLIRVNPREPDVHDGISVAMGALEFLEQVDELMD